MRIACSSCNAAYDIPPEQVPPGKGVKCARCGTVWVPVERVDATPPIEAGPVAAAIPAPEGQPEAEARPVAPVEISAAVAEPESAPRGRSLPVLLGWLLTVLVLVGLGWAAVTYRTAIVHAWPNAARAYALVGFR